MLGPIALILGIIGGFISLLVTIWKVRGWIWNRLPAVQRLKKDQEKYSNLCKAEADHLALLKALIAELEDGCVQETIACLQSMRATADSVTPDVLSSLRQRLSRGIEHINNEAAVAQTLHNRSIRKLEDE